MPKVKPKSHKGKRHPTHAASFLLVAGALKKASSDLMPEAEQAVLAVSRAMQAEGQRLRSIVR